MFTLLIILGVLIMITSIVLPIVYYCVWGARYSDAKSNMKYRSLYNYEEQTKLRDTAAKKLKAYWVAIFAVALFFTGITLCVNATRELSRAACDNSNGIWESWDSGFAWRCYNPSLIEADNNLRIIHANEE